MSVITYQYNDDESFLKNEVIIRRNLKELLSCSSTTSISYEHLAVLVTLLSLPSRFENKRIQIESDPDVMTNLNLVFDELRKEDQRQSSRLTTRKVISGNHQEPSSSSVGTALIINRKRFKSARCKHNNNVKYCFKCRRTAICSDCKIMGHYDKTSKRCREHPEHDPSYAVFPKAQFAGNIQDTGFVGMVKPSVNNNDDLIEYNSN